MEQATWLIAGLGNPGRQYEMNWHNSGSMVLEILSRRHSIRISRIRCQGLIGQGLIGNCRCYLLRPTTFMNRSGESVRQALAYFRIPLQNCLVLTDDVDLPFGQIRIRETGGAGTHNGMRSVVGSLGCEDFPRIRIGIGPQPENQDIADFVLEDIPADQRESFSQILAKAADAVEMILQDGLAQAMNQFNRK